MTLSSILIFIAFAVLFRLLARPRWRAWLLFVASVLAVYWLQPGGPVRYMDFWLPTLTLALAVLGWALTRPTPAAAAAAVPAPSARQNVAAGAALAGIVLLVGLTRFLNVSSLILPSRPPAFEQVLAAVALVALLAAGLARLTSRPAGLLWGAIGLLVALLVVIKTPALATWASASLRSLMNQSTTLAAAGDLRWLGFSYMAFRLIHTLRERQNKRLPAVTLQEYLVYVIFFPAFTAGPIDRIERFIKDLRGMGGETTDTGRQTTDDGRSRSILEGPATVERAGLGIVAAQGAALAQPQAWADWAAAGQRLALGLLKKFVVADGLALVALNATNAAQVGSAGWAWLLLYAYSLQIYFDFSGYTDIAIGLGRLLGISLPENFNAPYLRPNLTLFWNNWHMTLTNWFRAYYFNPVTRWLRTFHFSDSVGLPPQLIMFATQLSTFVLIGLWHGVTWNFVLWGAWHGVGLFVQNRWTEAARPRYAALENRPRLQKGLSAFTTLLTFHYVALGWVWFALPDVGLSARVMGKLFGM